MEIPFNKLLFLIISMNLNPEKVPQPEDENLESKQELTPTDRINVDPNSVNVDPSSVNVDPSSVNVDPNSVNVDPNSVNVDPSSVNVDPSSVNVDPNSVNVKVNLKASTEAFDHYLSQDMRIQKSVVDDELIETISKLTDKWILWKNVAAVSSNYITDKSKSVTISYGTLSVIVLPFVGYIIIHSNDPNTKQNLCQRLPNAFPISSIIIKRPTPMSWDTVDHTQYFHSVPWKNVYSTNYQNSSTFVLFHPNTSLQMQGHYLGKVKQIEKKPKSPILDLTMDSSGRFSLKQQKTKDDFFYTQATNAHRSALSKLFRKIFGMDKGHHSGKKALTVVQSIKTSNPEKLCELSGPMDTSNTFVLKRALLQSKGGSTDQKSVWYFKKLSIAKKHKKNVTPIETIKVTTTRNYHLLYSQKTILTTDKQLNTNWFKKRHTKPVIKKVDAQYYWQTYFHGFDLVPLKMESMHFFNGQVPESRSEEEKLLMLENEQREKTMDTVYEEAIQDYHRKLAKDELTIKKNPHLASVIQSSRAMENEETGFDELDARQEPVFKNALISAQQNLLFQSDKKTLTLSEIDALEQEQAEKLPTTAKETPNAKLPTTQKRLSDSQPSLVAVNTENQRRFPALFNSVFVTPNKINASKPGPKERKYQIIVSSKNQKRTMDPKTKIDLLTHKIQFELSQSLSPNLAFRQSTRYEVYNSLFRFKKLLGNQLNCLHGDISFVSKPLLSDGHLLKTKRLSQISKNKRISLLEPFIYQNIIADTSFFKTNYPKLKVDPNRMVEHDRFHFNRRSQKLYVRLMFNHQKIIPMTQKNWFMALRDQLKELNFYEDYRQFYENFFMKNSIVSPSAFIIDDIIESSQQQKDLIQKTPFMKGFEKLISEQTADVLKPEKKLNPETETHVHLLADGFKEALLETEFVDNLTEYINHNWIDLWENLRQTVPNVKPFTKSQARNYLNGNMIRDQLKVNNELINQYQSQLLRRGNKSNLRQTKIEIRKRVIEAQSPFLKRQLSGYLSPDASFRDKLIELMSWENLFQHSQFVQKYNLNRFLKFDFSKKTIASPFFQIYGLGQQNYFNYQRLINFSNPTPYYFKTFNSLTIKQGNLFERPEHINFFGKTITNFGVPFSHDPTVVLTELDDLPYSLDLGFAKEYETKMDQENEYDCQIPYSPPRNRLRYKSTWMQENRVGHDVSKPFNNQIPLSPSFLIEKAMKQGESYPANFHNFSSTKNQKDWLIYGATYSGMQKPIPAFLLDLNDRKTGTIYHLPTKVTDPAYISLVIFSYYVFRTLKHLDIDYRRSVIIGVQDFLNKLDSSTMKKIFEVNRAVVQCKDVNFSGVIGGARILNLFYSLILEMRKKSYTFNSLPISSFDLLQKLASSSVQLKYDDQEENLEFTVPFKTEKEAAIAHKIRLQILTQERYNERGYLLIGPPGTGKTYLVKALAGESMIPVIIPSKYTLAVQSQAVGEAPLQNKDEVLKIRQLFELAEIQQPCILFLDEIDSLGPDRQDVIVETKSNNLLIKPDLLLRPSTLVQNKAAGSWKTNGFIDLETLNLNNDSPNHWSTFNPIQATKNLAEIKKKPSAFINSMTPSEDGAGEPKTRKMTREALANLTQLLCSLDGLTQSKILVIGATNRPNALDPALIRPGRLHKVIYLDLPHKQKRLDLLKFYAGSQVTQDIDWDYFAKQTLGLSPAHLKAAMNLSALQTAYRAIQKHQVSPSETQLALHSQSTIEYGVQSLKDSNAFSKGYFKRCRRRINRMVLPTFLDSIGCFQSWTHVSLGTPLDPLELPLDKVSSLITNETLPSKADTQVWNGVPEYIPRFSFEDLYADVTKMILQPVGKTGSQRILKRKTASKLSDEERKKRRAEFYSRHRKELRKAYLFSDPTSIKYSLFKNKNIKDHPFANGFLKSDLLDKKSGEILQLFTEYVKRTFNVHLFGSKLLLNSTLFINNPLSFSTQYIYRKEKNTLIRSEAQFATFQSKTPFVLSLLKEKPTLFITPEQIQTKFQKLFSNHLALHRSLAYNANKAIMVHFLTDTYEQDHMYDIWARFRYDFEPEQYQKVFIKAVKDHLITRKQFENYLLSLAAGKVGEHLMLYYRNELPKFDPLKRRTGRYTYDVSKIGAQELYQMSWLLRIMIEKNLFYSPDIDLSKQVLTSEVQTRSTGKLDTSIVSVAVNKEFWVEFDKKTSRLMTKFDKNTIGKKILSLLIPQHGTYWWEPKGLVDLGPAKKRNSIVSWRSLFMKQPIPLQRMPAHLNYDTYRPNVLKTESLLDAPFDAKYLPPEFVQSATKLSANWNEGSRIDTERLLRALLLDAFSKTFYILIAQRELSDYLSYYLLLNGKMQANTLKKISQTFLEPIEKSRLEQLELNKQEKVTQE